MVMVISFSFQPSDGIANCAGDCFSCHPSLIGDPDHKSLSTCSLCHTTSAEKKSMDNFNFLPKDNVMSGCGDRCFQCHKEWPKDSYHASLESCLDCHEP